ncbi:MAG: tellurite resistance TerB family protein [Phyllobacteriaceae bacterium]|nr:tellurite resistance TerB family protein [Phyllobacteriaceae bacterium]
MFDPQKLLAQVLGGSSAAGSKGGLSPDLLKGLAGGAAAGGLASILLGSKSGKKLAKTALKVGGTAALAGLAYKAYQTWQQNQSGSDAAAPVPADVPVDAAGTVFLPTAAAARDDLSLILLRAMISAAKADGHIDADEQQKIFAKLDEAGLDTEAKAFVIDEMRKPLNIDAVVADATSPERAVEIYAASVLAIDADDPSEQAYLAMLAARLKLDPGLKATVEREATKALA